MLLRVGRRSEDCWRCDSLKTMERNGTDGDVGEWIWGFTGMGQDEEEYM
jgi:hypothetical protein